MGHEGNKEDSILAKELSSVLSYLVAPTTFTLQFGALAIKVWRTD